MHARRTTGSLDDAVGLAASRLTSATVSSIAHEEPSSGGGHPLVGQAPGPPPTPPASEAPPAAVVPAPNGRPKSGVKPPPIPQAAAVSGVKKAAQSASLTGAAPALRSLANSSTPARHGANVQLGAPLFPERADDPLYYPGIVDEVPDMQPSGQPVWKTWLAYIGAGLALFGAGLLTRSLIADPQPGWSAVIRTKPLDARVTLDGRVLIGQSPFRQDQLAPGEHQLRVERTGYVEFRESFLTDDQGGQREFVIVLDPIRALREAEDAPLVPRSPEPRPAPPPSPPPAAIPPAAAEVESPPDAAKQKRLEARAERLARSAERKEAAAAERAKKRQERQEAGAARREASAARAAERKEASAARAAARKEATAARAAERARKRAERSAAQ